jgi:hypothetical protein
MKTKCFNTYLLFRLNKDEIAEIKRQAHIEVTRLKKKYYRTNASCPSQLPAQ